MNIAIVIAVVATSGVPAHSSSDKSLSGDRWRVIVRPADGEIIRPHCAKEIADHVWRIVLKRPYIEVIDGKIAVRINEKTPTPAHRQTMGDVFTGVYDLDDIRTVSFGVRWKGARGRRVPVEITVAVRDELHAVFCHETWLGLGERI
jgi:hypothetical protein